MYDLCAMWCPSWYNLQVKWFSSATAHSLNWHQETLIPEVGVGTLNEFSSKTCAYKEKKLFGQLI